MVSSDTDTIIQPVFIETNASQANTCSVIMSSCARCSIYEQKEKEREIEKDRKRNILFVDVSHWWSESILHEFTTDRINCGSIVRHNDILQNWFLSICKLSDAASFPSFLFPPRGNAVAKFFPVARRDKRDTVVPDGAVRVSHPEADLLRIANTRRGMFKWYSAGELR